MGARYAHPGTQSGIGLLQPSIKRASLLTHRERPCTNADPDRGVALQVGRRSVAALGAAVLVAGFLAGCGSGSQSGGSDTTITLQHGYTDVEAKALTAQV